MGQGTLSPTGNDLDIAIRGEGFFKIQVPDGTYAYTRDGSFMMDAQGRVVTAQGNPVQPTITIPQNSSQITINAQGQLTVMLPGSTTPTLVGQIGLTRFINKAGLQHHGELTLRIDGDLRGILPDRDRRLRPDCVCGDDAALRIHHERAVAGIGIGAVGPRGVLKKLSPRIAMSRSLPVGDSWPIRRGVPTVLTPPPMSTPTGRMVPWSEACAPTRRAWS